MSTATISAPELRNGRTADGRLAVSVEEAGRLLDLSRSSTWKAVKDGTLRTVRVGHRVLVPVAAIEALLAGEQVSA